jgi:D-alanyl-D-alanine-carboxypeptidase/D-alanyl-D-alanine-endopeptidase
MRLMPHRRAFLLAPLAASVGAINADAETFSEEAIQAILVQRIDVGHQSTGIVAVVSDKAGNRLFTYGRPDTPDNRPLDGETVFEIGSTTKVLTALLLTDMVTRSEIAFGDPAAEYLPTSVRMPENKGKPITLVDLATYTSALPPMPDNIISKDPFNPFADYTIDQFYAFLLGYALKYEPGTYVEYSNVGFALLGHVLARRANKSYEDLLIERICGPLGRYPHHADAQHALTDRPRSQCEPRTWTAVGLADPGRCRRCAFHCQRGSWGRYQPSDFLH